MANFDGGMASGYVFRLNVWEAGTNAPGNYSAISWYVEILKGAGSGKWADGPHYWSVNIGGNVYSGSIGSYDFRGYTQLTLGSGTVNIGHNPDGSGAVGCSASFDDNNTWGELGDSGASGTLGMTTLKVTPGTPTITAATRVSDTQVNLSWTHSSASNGQPVSNQILKSVNDGPYTQVLDISATSSVSVAVAANQKVRFKVKAWNSAGFSGESAASAAVYTTPGAPTDVVSTKDAAMDITTVFVENVAYAEHEHEVWHGTVTGGVTTWDGSVLATLASGVLSYKHVDPDPAFQHVYRVRAKAGTLLSSYAVGNTVQLLAPPNAPVVPAMPSFADKASPLTFEWQHNPIDTTPQTAYEFEYSTNGGSSWTSTGKLVSAASSRTIAGGTHAANVVLQTRVRTWGSATTGGSEGTGASPWSTIRTVTYKTVPTATITSPTEGETLNDATLRVTVGFSQPEGASFVKAELELMQGAVVLETKESTIQVGITMDTPILNGEEYIIRVRVQDSNGLWSAWTDNTFDVVYLAPVPAVMELLYLVNNGFGQIGLTIPAPGAGQSAAVTLTITRTINGVEEIVVQNYPVEEFMTFLDTTPTIHGTNTYKVTTTSALGATSVSTGDLVTEECRKAFLSKGIGFDTVSVFGANLEVDEALSVASETVQAAGRTKPIGLYGVETSMQLKVSSMIFPREGFSTLDELRAILLVPGKACFRDATGRRTFGTVRGSVQYRKTDRGDLSFTMTETS